MIGVALIYAASGCENPVSAIQWERMINQARGKPYKSSPYFSDGRLMQPPPAGTIAIDQVIGATPYATGLDGNNYASTIPVGVDRAVLLHGEQRYDVFCATCHGVDGSGDSMVAYSMPLRKPPSLVVDPVRSFAPGRIFQVITDGYGLMPSYAMELSVDDRWAVVGYLHALQLSRSADLASLPKSVRDRATEALR
jgi:mono/diheme cytochrome c family protein